MCLAVEKCPVFKALRKQLDDLLALYQLTEVTLTIKKLRKNAGLYKRYGHIGLPEIIIDSEQASVIGSQVLRHEFAHHLQDVKGERLLEKKALRFELNTSSNYPYPPQIIIVACNLSQTKLTGFFG